MLVRDHVRWPVFILVAGLLVALTPFFQRGGALIPRMIPFAPPPDGPTATTDSQGRFRFEGLHNASHLLRLDPQSLPAGIQPASADLVMTLSPGVTRALTVAPGLVLRATYQDDGAVLDGVLFQDQDGDRQQSRGELGLRGVRVIDPDIFQYYTPFDDNNLQQSFADQLDPRCLTGRIASTTIASTISLTSSADGTMIYYDHWEDGYDADPIVPAPGSTTQVFTVNAGKVRTWQNDVPTPRPGSGAPLLYDGRDRITVVGQPVSAVRAAWLKPQFNRPNQEPGTRLAGAWEMSKVSDWGLNYVIPIGEDIGRGGTQTFGDYDYVSVSMMAAYDNTVVTFVPDPTNPGPTTRTYTLNAGQTAYMGGSANRPPISIRSGATVASTLPVQVQVRAGNCRAPYSGRSYTLVPFERWTNDYWSPVANFVRGQDGCRVSYQTQTTSADVDIYIYNPGAAPLPVTYEAPPPSPPLSYSTGVITIPAHSTGSYLKLRFPNPIPPGSNPRSNTQGVHLFSNNPAVKFWAVAAVDSTSLGNDGADFDWSYALIPAKDLSSRVVLSWSPGSDPSSAQPPLAGRVNGSVVFVQAVRDGTIVTVDLDGDGVFDKFDTNGDGIAQGVSAYGYNEDTSNTGITLRRGQMLRIGNPGPTHNMEGAIISTQDVRHPLAAVYGEDACVADFGAPYLDLGYTVLPLPTPTIDKTSRLLIDADHSGDISPGDTLEYKIQIYNSGTGPILDPQIIDTLPYTYTDFIVGSLRSDPSPAAPGVSYDDGSGTFSYVPTAPQNTPDPRIHALRAPYLIINPGDGVVVTLNIVLDRQIPRNVLAVINYAELRSSNTPPIKVPNRTPLNQVDLVVCKTDGRTSVQPGYPLTYTLTYTNTGPGIAYNVVMTDTLPTTPTTVLNVSTSPAVPGVITPTIALPHVYFQLGTLPAGRSGSATISLRLGPTPKGTDVINKVDIGTRSHEINLANNHCEDIDKVPGTTAVVLSEFLAERGDGGVLVRWRTIAEQDNYGFRLYRGTTPVRAGAALITPAIIPGQGRGRSDGASYSFFDADAPAGPLYYWLEDIDLFGVSTFHGPAQPTIQGAQYRVFLPIVMGGP